MESNINIVDFGERSAILILHECYTMPNTEWIVEFREDDGVVEIVVNGFTMAVVTKRIFDKYVAEREKIKQKSADGEISELQAEFNAIKEQLCQDDSLV